MQDALFCFIDFDNPKTFAGELTLKKLTDDKKHGRNFVECNFTGGEPLKRKDIVEKKTYIRNTTIQSIYITQM